jgi:hypothetical protein
LTALGWVVYGFVKHNNVARVSGLALAFFSVIKLLQAYFSIDVKY